MASNKKDMTEFDILKKEYGALVNLNQRLKNVCEIYYIAYSNIIYMKSLVPFIEKIAILNDGDLLNNYKGILYLPNQLFDFTKNAKKTKLTITQTDSTIYLGQNDNDDVAISLKRGISPIKEVIEGEHLFVNDKILPEFYSRYFEIMQNVKADKLEYLALSESMVEDISSAKFIELYINDNYVPITKQLLLDIKKNDDVFIAEVPISDVNENKMYYLLKNVNDIYTSYTLMSCIKNLL